MKKRSLLFKMILVVVSAALAVIDQFTKYLAVIYIKPQRSISLLKSGSTEILNLTYCENTGMSFSLLQGHRVILIIVPVLLIAAVEWLVFSDKIKRTDMLISLAVLAGGGLGNLIDRAFQGYVVDFIDFRIINFAVFNFADICAVCGGLYLGVMYVIEEIKEEKAKKLAGKAEDEDGEEDDDPECVSDEQA